MERETHDNSILATQQVTVRSNAKNSQGAESGEEKQNFSMANTNKINNPTIIRYSQNSLLIFVLQAISFFVLALIGYNLRNLVSPSQRGFFCGDRSIRYPYYDSTVSTISVFFAGNFLLIGSITLIELFYHNNPRTFTIVFGCPLPIQYFRCLNFFYIFQIGFIVNMLLTSVAKVSMGSLRPHFIDVCKPILLTSTLSKKNENESTSFLAPLTSLENCPPDRYLDYNAYVCNNNTDPYLLSDARLSFFSGHSSTAFYFAVFISLYIYCRIGRRENNLSIAGFLAYTVLIGMAEFVAISRIVDNKHHPVDVIVGSLVGSAVAIINVLLHRYEFTAPSSARRANGGNNSITCSDKNRPNEKPTYHSSPTLSSSSSSGVVQQNTGLGVDPELGNNVSQNAMIMRNGVSASMSTLQRQDS